MSLSLQLGERPPARPGGVTYDAEVHDLFDAVVEMFGRAGAAYRAIATLVDGLSSIYEKRKRGEWIENARRLAGSHPVTTRRPWGLCPSPPRPTSGSA